MIFSRSSQLLLLLAVASPLWLLPLGASAVKCGNKYSSSCLGETDTRYDKSASNALVDQDPLWGEMSGLWVVDARFVNGDGSQREPDFINVPYDQQIRVFRNLTVEGSRLYQKVFVFFLPAPQSFCDLPVPEGLSNVSFGSSGVCGVNGFRMAFEQFGTSSYERDGTVNMFWGNDGTWYSGPMSSASKMYPVGDDTIYTHTSDVNVWGETTILTSTDTIRGSSIDSVMTDAGWEERDMIFNGVRVKDANEWLGMIEQAKIDFSITDEDWSQYNSPGGNSTCISKLGCPTSEEFCTIGNDPECSESPYQEPPATMKPGYIALFTLLGVFFFGGIGYLFHRRQMQKQASVLKGDAGLQDEP